MNFENGNVYFFICCVTVLFLIGGPETAEARGFEFGAYCRKLCAWGKGGNLCKCSAVHFAGKRGDEFAEMADSGVLGNGGGFYDEDLPEFTEKSEEERKEPKLGLDAIRKVYRQMESMNRHEGPSKTTKMILATLQRMLNMNDNKDESTDLS